MRHDVSLRIVYNANAAEQPCITMFRQDPDVFQAGKIKDNIYFVYRLKYRSIFLGKSARFRL